MTAADAPELPGPFDFAQWLHLFKDGFAVSNMHELTAIRAMEVGLALERKAADLAGKLAEAEREWEELLETAQLQSDRAIRAEAALVAAQEAAKPFITFLARHIHPFEDGSETILLELQVQDFRELRDAAALPITAAKPEGE